MNVYKLRQSCFILPFLSSTFCNEQAQGKEGKIVHSHGITDSTVIPRSEDGSLLSA